MEYMHSVQLQCMHPTLGTFSNIVWCWYMCSYCVENVTMKQTNECQYSLICNISVVLTSYELKSVNTKVVALEMWSLALFSLCQTEVVIKSYLNHKMQNQH